MRMNKAARIIASIFGVLAGIPGIAYGIFETNQGNNSTNGIIIDAIGPNSKYWHGGEAPAISIVPNYLVTGIFAIIMSVFVITWAVAFIHVKRGWLIWVLLSIVQLLVGGGGAQIMLVPIVGIIASQINSPLTWWKLHLSKMIQSIFEKIWIWLLIISSFLYFLHYSIPIIIGLNGSFLGTNNSNIGLIIGYSAIIPFLFTIIIGFTNDKQRRMDLVEKMK
jgi:hypothetical protein